MNYTVEHMAAQLRAAREAKGLSQRQLSSRSGVMQGHISKIENGAVDLRLSSLAELARALELELVLVPRRALPAIQTIARSVARTPSGSDGTIEMNRRLARLGILIGALPDGAVQQEELDDCRRMLRDLGRSRLTRSDLDVLKTVYDRLQDFRRRPERREAVDAALAALRQLSRSVALRSTAAGAMESGQHGLRFGRE